MPRKRGSRKRSSRRRVSVGAWLGLAVLAAAIGFVAGYLLREIPEPPVKGPAYRDDLAEFQSLLGPLQRSGTPVDAASGQAAEQLLRRLEHLVQKKGATALLGPVTRDREAMRFHLSVNGSTYPVEIRWPSVDRPGPPRLAVVIDDVGRDLDMARALLDLDIPVTLSILPHLPHSRSVAQLAGDRGREYLLHLPMEPQGYPEKDPGTKALLEKMKEAQIRELVRVNLDAVPGASGVNNHMGSRLTELGAPMEWVMDELKDRGLYFFDSLTTGRSLAAAVARETGIGWAERDIFLDNARNQQAIGKQIDKAIRRAKQAGQAIAIGHPHRETLDALQAWAPRIREAGVQVVHLGALVRRGEARAEDVRVRVTEVRP